MPNPHTPSSSDHARHQPGPSGPPGPAADASALTFEQCLQRIEEIVRRVEAGEIGLEDSLLAYEEGVKLLTRCRSMLESAEQRVDELSLEALENDRQRKTAGRHHADRTQRPPTIDDSESGETEG